MPDGLKRYYGRGDFHFVTFSCYRRLDLLGTKRARNLVVEELARVRRERGFRLAGRNDRDQCGYMIGERKRQEDARPTLTNRGWCTLRGLNFVATTWLRASCRLQVSDYLPRNFSRVESSASAMSRYFLADLESCFCIAACALEMSVFMRC